MTIERRIEKLEEETGPSEQVILYILDKERPKPTEAQKEAAIADYKAKHPDWETHSFMVIDMNPEPRTE